MLHVDIFIWYVICRICQFSFEDDFIPCIPKASHNSKPYKVLHPLWPFVFYHLYTHPNFILILWNTFVWTSHLILICSSHLSGALWKTIFYNPPNIRANPLLCYPFFSFPIHQILDLFFLVYRAQYTFSAITGLKITNTNNFFNSSLNSSFQVE